MAKSKLNSPSPKANSNGTSARPNAAAPPTRKPARPSRGQENKRRDGACPLSGANTRPAFSILAVAWRQSCANNCGDRLDAGRYSLFSKVQRVDSGVQISAVDLEKTGYTTSTRNLPPPRHHSEYASAYDSHHDRTIRRSLLSSRDVAAPLFGLRLCPGTKPKLRPRNPRAEARRLRPARRT